MTDALQIFLIASSIPVLVALVVYTVRQVRALDRRIDEYREEQESQPGKADPYQQMAKLYDVGGDGSSNERYPDQETPNNRSKHQKLNGHDIT